MDSWRLYTPDGVNDVLTEECSWKREVEQKIMGVFKSYGYRETETPIIEFYDVFADTHSISQERMFKFFDNQGRILVLRPDITTPIARMVGTKLQGKQNMPLRICYTGKAFRYDGTYQRSTQREFTQAGIELLGISNPKADGEILAVTVQALVSAGLSEFQIEIGQVGFFKGLIKQAGLDDKTVKKLCDLINKKDTFGLETVVNGLNMEEKLKKIFIELPHYFGEIDVLDKIDLQGLNDESKYAIQNIREVYEIICDYNLEQYVSVDMAMLQDINYYTGIIFKGVTTGVGTPICGGGRYDNLMENFGKACSATGVAIGIDRVMSALYRQHKEVKEPKINALIYCEKGAEKSAVKIADSLRKKGLIVERYLEDESFAYARQYAKEKGIESILRVRGGSDAELYDLKEGEDK